MRASNCWGEVIGHDSKARNEKHSQSDRDQILRDRDCKIRNTQTSDQPDASLISAECSGDSTDRASQGTQPNCRAACNCQARAGEGACNNSR